MLQHLNQAHGSTVCDEEEEVIIVGHQVFQQLSALKVK
jgi:hypothetical protein